MHIDKTVIFIYMVIQSFKIFKIFGYVSAMGIDHIKLSFCVSYDHTVMYTFKFFTVSGWHMICSHSNYSVLTVYNSMLYIYREIITESMLFIDITKIIPPSYFLSFTMMCRNYFLNISLISSRTGNSQNHK